MEHTHTDGTPVAWSKIQGLGVQPIVPDAFHHSKTEVKNFTYRRRPTVSHVTDLPDIEGDSHAWWSGLDAWLHSGGIFSIYHRETVWAMLARPVYRLARSEDAFQKGMMGVWDNLGTWTERYPISHEPTSEEDEKRGDVLGDVIRYLCGVARNAMSGRKRKPVLFDDRLVEHAEDNRPRSLSDDDIRDAIEEMSSNDTDRDILWLKSQRHSEAEIGSKSRPQPRSGQAPYQAALRTLLHEYGCQPTPMGRTKRKSSTL